MNNFLPLKVVDRGSETQLLVGENLNYIIYRFKGQSIAKYILYMDNALSLIIAIHDI